MLLLIVIRSGQVALMCNSDVASDSNTEWTGGYWSSRLIILVPEPICKVGDLSSNENDSFSWSHVQGGPLCPHLLMKSCSRRTTVPASSYEVMFKEDHCARIFSWSHVQGGSTVPSSSHKVMFKAEHCARIFSWSHVQGGTLCPHLLMKSCSRRTTVPASCSPGAGC